MQPTIRSWEMKSNCGWWESRNNRMGRRAKPNLGHNRACLRARTLTVTNIESPQNQQARATQKRLRISGMTQVSCWSSSFISPRVSRSYKLIKALWALILLQLYCVPCTLSYPRNAIEKRQIQHAIERQTLKLKVLISYKWHIAVEI